MMKLTRFNTIVYLLITLLLLFISFFAFLNLKTGVSVINTEINGTSEKAELEKQIVKIQFNRPLSRENDLQTLVSVSPSTEYRSQIKGKDLYLIFTNNLLSNTEYTIKLQNGITDLYGYTTEQQTEIIFRTKSNNLLYIENNQVPEKDKLIRYSIDGKSSQILLEAEKIHRFTQNRNLVALFTDTSNQKNILQVYDLEEKKYLYSNVGTPSSFSYFAQFSPDNQYLYYLSQDTEELKSGDRVPTGQIKLLKYSLKTGESTLIEYPTGITEIDQFILSPDGNSIVARDSLTLFYHLINLTNPEKNTNLGRFVETGGFSRDGSQIIFAALKRDVSLNRKGGVIVSSDDENLVIPFDSGYMMSPTFLHNSPLVTYSHIVNNDESNESSQTSIVEIYNTELNRVEQITEKGLSIEFPKVSPDDRYIVMEAYTDEQVASPGTERVVNARLKPATSRIYLYDLITREITNTGLIGIEPTWER